MNLRQEYLLKMLRVIDDICTRNHIDYFIIGGTLIGAVRNGGFLPWDDDADIAMPYHDYIRFVEACKTDLPDAFRLCDPVLDERYRRVLPRLISTETTSIHTSSSLHDDIAGEIIDINVLDPIGDGDEAWQAYVQDLFLYSSVVNYANANGTRVEVDPDAYLEMKRLVEERGLHSVSKLLDQRLISHHDDSGRYYAYRWKGWPGLLERSWFDNPKRVRFEGYEFSAPGNIDEFLRAFFGEEWFFVPSYVTPVKHKSAASTLFPYTEALEFYRPTYSREELMKACEERIALRLKNAKENNNAMDEGARVRARVAATEVNAVVAENREVFDDALSRRDGAALAGLLRDYLEIQSGKSLIGRPYNAGMYRYFKPVLIDVDDDVFEAALLAFATTSRISFARRMLEIARKNGREITPGMIEVEKVVDAFHACVAAYESHRHSDGVELARWLVGEVPSSSEFHMLLCDHLKALYEQDANEENRIAWEEGTRHARALFPEEGFFAKHEADFLWEDGKTDEAVALYVWAAERTKNGFALREIADRCGYHPHWIRDAEWAEAAGVPQWNGEDPGRAAPPREEGPQVYPGTRELYLLRLLGEAADLCRENGVDCVLSPQLAQVIRDGRRLPADPGSYALLCKPEHFPRLISCEVPSNRRIGYMGNDTSVRSRHVRYYGTDSLCFSLKKEPDELTGLFVTLVPLEPVAYPYLLGRVLRQWDESKAPVYTPRGAWTQTYSFFHRTAGDRLEAGERLFKSAMKYCRRRSRRCVRTPAAVEISDKDLFGNRDKVSIEGLEFDAPKAGGALSWPASEAFKLSVPAGYVSSAAGLSYPEFVKLGGVEDGYFERRRAVMQKNQVGEQTFKRFSHNFKQMELAVRLKELSLELMPQKERIMALHRKRDYKALRTILDSYMKCARKYEKYGDALFDEDLFKVMKDTMKHSG